MASLHPTINGVLSPPAQQDTNNDSITLSAKRKRDDINDANHHANSLINVKGAEPSTATSIEDTQTIIRDLVAVLKQYVTTDFY